MSKRPASHKIRDVVFGILSFMLALLLTLLSFCVVAEATVFNKTTWLDIMNGTEYYQNKTDEIRKDLVDLGYASGLEESFFNDSPSTSLGNNVNHNDNLNLKGFHFASVGHTPPSLRATSSNLEEELSFDRLGNQAEGRLC